jgi:hypothetical protein
VDTKSFDLKFTDSKADGSFTAVFSTLNVIDKDGDITLPGALGNQEVIIAGYNHASWGTGTGALPSGKGRIYENGNEGIVEGKFFLDTIAGAETYKTVKAIGSSQEWSYSLPEIDFEFQERDGKRVRLLKRIKVNEVSPVLMGAGNNTRLLDIKSADFKKACPTHSTATDNGSWDAGAMLRRARSGEKRAYYNRMFGWNNPETDSSLKSSYKFPHHLIHSDGEPGAASTKACIAGIAVLNGGRGGANIPDADRTGVYAHLSAHLNDAKIEAPELLPIDGKGTHGPLKESIEMLIVNMGEVVTRMEEVGELRKAEGRRPAETTIQRVEVMKSGIIDLLGRIKNLETENQNPAYAEYLKFIGGIHNVKVN